MRTRFRDIEEYRSEKARSKALVDGYGDALEGHWRNLKDKEFRGELIMNTASDIVSNLRPVRLLGSVFGKDHGTIGNLAGTLLAFNAKGLKGKLLAWAAATVAPMLIERVLHSEWLDRWISSTKESLEEEEDPDDPDSGNGEV